MFLATEIHKELNSDQFRYAPPPPESFMHVFFLSFGDPRTDTSSMYFLHSLTSICLPRTGPRQVTSSKKHQNDPTCTAKQRKKPGLDAILGCTGGCKTTSMHIYLESTNTSGWHSRLQPTFSNCMHVIACVLCFAMPLKMSVYSKDSLQSKYPKFGLQPLAEVCS